MNADILEVLAAMVFLGQVINGSTIGMLSFAVILYIIHNTKKIEHDADK